MTKTSLEVVNQTLRQLAVVAQDEPSSGDDYTFCKDVLDATLAEIAVTHALAFTWTVETVPDSYFMPLAHLLSARVAPHYLVQAPIPESRAIGMLRAQFLVDNRTEDFDADEDGALSTAEQAAKDRAAYY